MCHPKSNLHQQPRTLQVHVFPADEDDMAETIITFQNAGFLLTVSRLRSLAYQYAKINGIKGFNDKKEMGGGGEDLGKMLSQKIPTHKSQMGQKLVHSTCNGCK